MEKRSDTCCCCSTRRLEVENERLIRQGITYKWEEMVERVEEMNKGGLSLSNQYGMVFLLNQSGQIVLNLSPLLTREERMKHA